MKLNKKAGLLTGGMFLLGSFLAPQASANDINLGVIPALFSQHAGDTSPLPPAFVAGAFTDTFDFQVSGNALLNDYQTATGYSGSYSGGVDITSLTLWDNGILVATGGLTQSIATIPTVPALVIDTYTDTLSNILLVAGDTYTLKVSGDYLTPGSSYTGTLATSPAAVPLPSAAWLFLTATMGFLGLKRRKNSIG